MTSAFEPRTTDVWRPQLGAEAVDFSVKVTRDRVAGGRWVRYGLDRPEIEAFLQARGVPHAVDDLFAALAPMGEPFRVMIGVDGPRTKLYGDLSTDDPGMVCIDAWPDRPSLARVYTRAALEDAAPLFARCEPGVADGLRWLAARPDFQARGVAHIAFQGELGAPRLLGGDVGYMADWESLVEAMAGARDRAPMMAQATAEEALARFGLGHQLTEFRRAFERHEGGYVNYIGLRRRPSGDMAINVYVIAPPVSLQDGAWVAHHEEGHTFRPRPLMVRAVATDGLAAGEHVLRFRVDQGRPGLARAGAWTVDHGGAPRNAVGPETRAFVRLAKSVAEEHAAAAGRSDLLALVTSLRADPRIAEASVALEPLTG